MMALLQAEDPAGGRLAGIFRRKSSKGVGVLEAEAVDPSAYDALDTFHHGAAGPAEPPAHQGSKTDRGWGILARRNSWSGKAGGGGTYSSGGGGGPLQASSAAAVEAELAAARGEYARQGAELAQLRGALAAAQGSERRAWERLNLQRFKYELLVDLWSMRVLDNEELGACS